MNRLTKILLLLLLLWVLLMPLAMTASAGIIDYCGGRYSGCYVNDPE